MNHLSMRRLKYLSSEVGIITPNYICSHFVTRYFVDWNYSIGGQEFHLRYQSGGAPYFPKSTQ